jgi:hypothetical protein
MTLEIPQRYQKQVIETTIANLRKQPFHNPKAQSINENWIKEAFGVSREQCDKIGMLWMTKILGVDQKVAEAFASGEFDAEHQIGLLHAGSRTYEPDIKSFWKSIAEVAPQLARSNDLKFIINNDHEGEGAWAMICALDGMNPMSDCLITQLVSNALDYK